MLCSNQASSVIPLSVFSRHSSNCSRLVFRFSIIIVYSFNLCIYACNYFGCLTKNDRVVVIIIFLTYACRLEILNMIYAVKIGNVDLICLVNYIYSYLFFQYCVIHNTELCQFVCHWYLCYLQLLFFVVNGH